MGNGRETGKGKGGAASGAAKQKGRETAMEVLAAFDCAIDVARRQAARMLEDRALAARDRYVGVFLARHGSP